MLNSCSRFVNNRVEYIHTTDSIFVEKITYRDTTIFVELPPKVIEKEVFITDTLYLAGEYSRAQAWVFENKLFGFLHEGTAPVEIEYKYKDKEVIKRVTELIKETIAVPYVPKWITILIFALSTFIVLLLVVIRFS